MKLRELRAKREAKARDYRAVIDNAGDNFTAEDAAKTKAIGAEIDLIDDQITALERVARDELPTVDDSARRAAEQNGLSTDENAARIAARSSAFKAWLKGGENALSADQRAIIQDIRADQSKGTDSAGGFTVPDEFANLLLEALKDYGGVREVAYVMRSATGRSFEWPTNDDTSNVGELVGENGSVAAVTDLVFGTKSVGAFKYSSKPVAASMELLQDTGIDMEGFIRKALATRIARITNQHFTTGTGSGQPQGIVTGSTVGVTATTGNTTSIAYNHFVDLEHSIDPAYRRQGCGWMFNDAILKLAKKLVDSQGRPLWLPGMASGEPATILNYGYTINQDMAVPAANAKTMLFGKLDDYIVRDVMDVQLFRMTDSVFTTKGQVGFLSFSRHDGKYVAGGASIKHFAQSAA